MRIFDNNTSLLEIIKNIETIYIFVLDCSLIKNKKRSRKRFNFLANSLAQLK